MKKRFFNSRLFQISFCLSTCLQSFARDDLNSPMYSSVSSIQDEWNFDQEEENLPSLLYKEQYEPPFHQPSSTFYSIDGNSSENQTLKSTLTTPNPSYSTFSLDLSSEDFEKIKKQHEHLSIEELSQQTRRSPVLNDEIAQEEAPNPIMRRLGVTPENQPDQATTSSSATTPATTTDSLIRPQAPQTNSTSTDASNPSLPTTPSAPSSTTTSNGPGPLITPTPADLIPQTTSTPVSPATAPVTPPLTAPTTTTPAVTPPATPAPQAASPTTGTPLPTAPSAPLNAPTNQTAPTDIPAILPAPSPLEVTENPPGQRTILINFNNVSMVEFIRFVSRISNKNFVFDENDLQFNVTIVSEEPTTIDNIMTALLQELRIHDLGLLEQGNNVIIHRNPKVGNVSQVLAEDLPSTLEGPKGEVVTRVFRLNTVDVDTATAVLRPMLSEYAIVAAIKNTNHLIVTDLTSNINEIAKLLKSVDSPQSGLVIGQYVVRFAYIDTLIQLAQRIMQPISQDQPLIFVPHNAASSIFIVSTPYFVERTISILQYLDQNQGTTQILNPREMSFPEGSGPGRQPGEGRWRLDPSGTWRYETELQGDQPPQGRWTLDPDGNWRFEPGRPGANEAGGPDGQWILNPKGIWVYQLNPGRAISPETLRRQARFTQDLPVGNIARTKFYIHKLRYRRGDQIVQALSRISESLQLGGTTNQDLVMSISGIQWIESSNSLVFTGTPEAIEKIKELIQEIDVPLRQVFLEMLILETTVDDSLNFSVNPGARFGGGNQAGSESFISGVSTLPAMLNTTGINILPNPAIIPPVGDNFSLGVIGQEITHNGTRFASLAALVRALNRRDCTKIILNPKILTEDNSPAEIFVGENTQFPTQSIANNNGNILTQNFEFRDVGTRLKVTPLIGNNNIITLDIQEEFSRIRSGGVNARSTLTQQVIGPTTTVSRTTTKVHMPDGFFLVLSGALREEERRLRIQTPCLGGIPILGAAFSDKLVTDQKRNLMIFIHPRIIDTDEEIQNLTRHQQDIYRAKGRRKSIWRYEVDEALDFFNLEDIEDTEGEQECF